MIIILEVILFIVNLIISSVYINKKNTKIIGMTLSLISIMMAFWGYIQATLFIMDAVYTEKQVRIGNQMIIIGLLLELLICIILIIEAYKNKKEGGKEKCQE